MNANTDKKVEGYIEELNPTTIKISEKTIYLPQEKREFVKEKNLTEGEGVRVFYTSKGNLVDVVRLTDVEKALIPVKTPKVAKIIDAEAEQQKKMHINNPTTVAASPVVETVVHIQQETTATVTPQPESGAKTPKTDLHIHKPEWITEREKNTTIILESVLARAVELVNANFEAFATTRSLKESEKQLDDRCRLVEVTTDRLYDYIKKKVKDEQDKK